MLGFENSFGDPSENEEKKWTCNKCMLSWLQLMSGCRETSFRGRVQDKIELWRKVLNS